MYMPWQYARKGKMTKIIFLQNVLKLTRHSVKIIYIGKYGGQCNE